jgi:hypothetical protein
MAGSYCSFQLMSSRKPDFEPADAADEAKSSESLEFESRVEPEDFKIR